MAISFFAYLSIRKANTISSKKRRHRLAACGRTRPSRCRYSDVRIFLHDRQASAAMVGNLTAGIGPKTAAAESTRPSRSLDAQPLRRAMSPRTGPACGGYRRRRRNELTVAQETRPTGRGGPGPARLRTSHPTRRRGGVRRRRLRNAAGRPRRHDAPRWRAFGRRPEPATGLMHAAAPVHQAAATPPLDDAAMGRLRHSATLITFRYIFHDPVPGR